MSENLDNLPPLSPDEPPPPPRPPQRTSWFMVVLAWLVILGVVARAVVPHEELPQAQNAQESVSLLLHQIIGRLLVAQKEMLPEPDRNEAVAPSEEFLQSLDTGPVPDRLRLVTVRADLAGPAAGLEALEQLQGRMAAAGKEPTPDEAALIDLLGRLYGTAAQERLHETAE